MPPVLASGPLRWSRSRWLACRYTADPWSGGRVCRDFPVTADGTDNPRRRSDASRSEPSSALDASAAGGRARITNELPGGSVPSLAEIKCLNRRITRWRTTEFPTALLTTKPALAAEAASDGSVVNAWTTRRRLPALAPRRITARKSSLRRNRAATGSTTPLDGGRIRRTAQRGPCDGEPPGWTGRRGSACAAGTRAPGRVGGCSAGRCAYPCSRLTSPVSRPPETVRPVSGVSC